MSKPLPTIIEQINVSNTVMWTLLVHELSKRNNGLIQDTKTLLSDRYVCLPAMRILVEKSKYREQKPYKVCLSVRQQVSFFINQGCLNRCLVMV